MASQPQIEALAALFDHIDGWHSRRRVLPMDIRPELDDSLAPEEWTGGGQVLSSNGRRLIWRSRGTRLEVAELSSSRDHVRNGMELPFAILSRDAICFEQTRKEVVLWALTRNLVLHAVPFKQPSSASTSLLAVLPSREACDGIALRPPTGSYKPQCCTWITPHHLLIGYENGKVQSIQIQRQSPQGEGGVGGGVGREVITVLSSTELPSSGWGLGRFKALYGTTPPPTQAPCLAVNGIITGPTKDEIIAFSLHTDRKLRICKKGADPKELTLPGVIDRGVTYSNTSKLVIYHDAQLSTYRLIIALAEPSHSIIWMSRAFSVGEDFSQWRPEDLAEHMWQEEDLVVDVLVTLGDIAIGGGGQRETLMWVAMPSTLAYAKLFDVDTVPAAAAGDGPKWTRVWQPPTNTAEDIRLLLPHQQQGGRSSSKEALRQHLGTLYERLGKEWGEVVRHMEASFLRILSSPHRYSPMALWKAIDRMKSTGTSSTSLALLLGSGSSKKGVGRGGEEGGGGERPLGGERLWSLVMSVVRNEADRAIGIIYQESEHNEPISDDRKALILVQQWHQFYTLAEESREVVSQPLALIAPPLTDQDPILNSPLVIRVDRASVLVKTPLPLPHTPILNAFEEWIEKSASNAIIEIGQFLAESSEVGEMPDPVVLQRVASKALDNRRGTDPGLVLNDEYDLEHCSADAVGDIRRIAEALRCLFQINTKRGFLGGSPGRRIIGLPVIEADKGEVDSIAASTLSAAVMGSVMKDVLAWSLIRARTALLLLVHLQAIGLHDDVVLSCFPGQSDQLAPPLPPQLARTLNCAWLLNYIINQPQLPPAPIRPPSVASTTTNSTTRSTTLAGGSRQLSVAESLFLMDRLDLGVTTYDAIRAQVAPAAAHRGEGGPPIHSSNSLIQEALRLLYKALPARLLKYLEESEQHRYLYPWAQALVQGAVIAEEDVDTESIRQWQRLIIYSWISEGRRLGRQVQSTPSSLPQVEALFNQAMAALKAWDTCLAPVGDRPIEDPTDEAIPSSPHNDRQIRLAHYVKAVSLLEQSLGLPGCPPRHLAELAYAGLRIVPIPNDSGNLDEETVESNGYMEWCHKHAASLWATVFRAGADQHTAGTTLAEGGEGEGSFEEAFLAMRAELKVAHVLEEMAEREEKQMAGETGTSMTSSRRRSKNSKLSYLITELCERGRIDLVCSLPWEQSDHQDEVHEIENSLRSSARFSTIEGCGDDNDQQQALSITSSTMEGSSSAAAVGSNLFLPPVDYFKAAYAFLASTSNYSMAAKDMYRLVRRLEDGMAFEDHLPKLEKKIETLSIVQNCLLIMQQSGAFPFFSWVIEDRMVGPPSTSRRLSSGSHVEEGEGDEMVVVDEEEEMEGEGGGLRSRRRRRRRRSSTTTTTTTKEAGGGGGMMLMKRTVIITLKQIEQELAYALAARQYLRLGGSTAVSDPLRPLGLALALHEPGKGDNTIVIAVKQKVENTAARLCSVGLYDSAANLLKAFSFPLTPIIGSLAKTYVMLRTGRRDASLVLEDGPTWDYGDVEESPIDEDLHGGGGGTPLSMLVEGGGGEGEGMEEEEGQHYHHSTRLTKEEKGKQKRRRLAYLRLANLQGTSGEERVNIAEKALAAGWFLKDLVQKYDAKHSMVLHTEAARYILACDSFLELPSWLSTAFTRGVEAHLLPSSSRIKALSWIDPTTGKERIPVADSGAFLQMHVDKAYYILAKDSSSIREGDNSTPNSNSNSLGAVKEALHLFNQGLAYAKEMIDAASDRLMADKKKVWLPRTAVSALVNRAREVMERTSSQGIEDEEVYNYIKEGQEKLKEVERVMGYYEQVVKNAEMKEAVGLRMIGVGAGAADMMMGR